MRAYRHDLLSVLRDSSNLPHLQAIDHNAETKKKGGSDDPYFIDSVLYSSIIQQLSLRELSFPSPYSWVLSGHKPDYCQLRQLYIHDCDPANSQATEPTIKMLIRGSCPNLETFYWCLDPQESSSRAAYTLVVDKHPMPEFNKLRNMYLGIKFADEQTWNCLLSAPLLQVLGLQVDERDSKMAPRLRSLGHKRHLKTFAWSSSRRRFPTGIQDIPLEFLECSNQISRLSLTTGFKTIENSNDVLGYELLPLLSHSFRFLTSLRICWDGWCVLDDHIKLISDIRSLEQICLSTEDSSLGIEKMSRYWFIDHDTILYYLGKLPKLKRIAFQKDIYTRLLEDYNPNLHPQKTSSLLLR
jgi:hypothetical protein